MNELIKLDTVDKYNKMYGLETLHPLVSVIDLTKSTKFVNHISMNYDIYAIYLKESKSCEIKYGCRYYDYQEGTIVCFAPGQIAEVSTINDENKPKVYGLIFHPDLIRGTSLGQNIRAYTFFLYSVNEALHLSERERSIIINCLNEIQMELEHAIDNHSKRLIVSHIELLLNYCVRFYERQFITRCEANKGVLSKFEQYIYEYLQSNQSQQEGIPSVKYFADKICLSSNYFGDLIKKETGKSAQAYIQDKIIDYAKERILGTQNTINEIAYELGYQYPHHFNRIFKKNVGCTPNEYRTQHKPK